MDELVSENSKLKLQHRSLENTTDLLKKQLEGGEKMRKEYQKRYESAIDDINKLSDQFKHRINDLESKCKSIHDEHSKLMDVLGSTRLEASEWKRKYEETLDENGVRSNSKLGVDASITRCDKLVDWKIKYENLVSEQIGVLEKIAAMEEKLKQVSAAEDSMRAEFFRVLDEKEKVIAEKDVKLVIMEQQLASMHSELKKAELFDTEMQKLNSITVYEDGAKDGELGVITGNSSKKSFKFDSVYTPKDGQVDVFADASPMVVSVLDGYNVCIFAYGQTGTGKTFTMEGTPQNRGVNYRTVEQLFEVARERWETFSYDISVSVLEVYNEHIRDLLATSPSTKKLEIKQSYDGSHHVPGLVEAKVENINEMWNVLLAGSNARAVGSNNVNEHSSRSHCMLSIMVKAKNLMNGECTRSKLWFVDLAGSERLAKTDVQGERLKEAQNINRSLSALGDVIYALATKSSHIPYRNSKLTHLLQDSLGGDSKTLMFVHISPSEQDKMKAMFEKARQESRCKDEAMKKLEENIQNLESKDKGRGDPEKEENEYELFLRFNISLYKNKDYEASETASMTDGEGVPSVPIEELLADLDLSEEEEDGEEDIAEFLQSKEKQRKCSKNWRFKYKDIIRLVLCKFTRREEAKDELCGAVEGSICYPTA